MTLLLLACTGGSLVVDGPVTDDSAIGDSSRPVDTSHDIEEVPGVGELSDVLFNDEVLPEFDVLLSDEAFSSLASDPYNWVEGGIVFDGVTYEGIGVRVKGENSYLPISQKASLKLKFDKYDPDMRFLKLEELTLNNMSNDYSMMHERLSYRQFRESGLPAPRANHALVSINGEHVGLYTVLETVDRDFIKRWYDNTEGPMFEVWDVDFKDYYIDSFQLEFGEDDRTQLQGVADTLEDSGDDAYEAAAEYLDWEQFTKWWANGIIVGQYDGYPYADPGDDCHVFVNQDNLGPAGGPRLEWIPHGMDETYYYPTGVAVLTQVNGIVAKRCTNVAQCQDMVVEQMNVGLDRQDEIGTLEYFDMVEAQIKDHVTADTNKNYTDEYVWYYQDAMRSFIASRRSDLSRWTD
ncbi:MAG TPA: CotH kinase family protein [Myxococcota bacterium]|nr:CotH kinase family protein [Myxococcota bacterium]